MRPTYRFHRPFRQNYKGSVSLNPQSIYYLFCSTNISFDLITSLPTQIYAINVGPCYLRFVQSSPTSSLWYLKPASWQINLTFHCLEYHEIYFPTTVTLRSPRYGWKMEIKISGYADSLKPLRIVLMADMNNNRNKRLKTLFFEISGSPFQ